MPRTTIAQDAFTAPPLSASNWAQLNVAIAGNLQVTTAGRATGQFGAQGTYGRAAARWVGAGSFTAAQYSEVPLFGANANTSTIDGAGVIVRASADAGGARDYYEAYVTPSPSVATYIAKWVNGTRTELATGTTVAWANGDLLGLEVEEVTGTTTLHLTKNGTRVGGAWTVTDTSSPITAAGAPGLSVAGSSCYAGGWEGGNVTASGGDTNPPTLTSPTGIGGTLAATGSVNTNEGTGTLYYLVSTTATETVPAQGQPMTGWSSQAVATTGAQNVSATGLAAGTRYMHYVHDDAAGNRSARASSASFSVAASGTTYSLVLSRVANNTGAGKKVSTTFTGTLVYGGHFNDLAGKTLHAITTTGVNADGDATLTGLPQTGAAMLLRRWADGALSVEFVTVA